ncbi:phosphomannose isomerase type I [Phycomyces nitens]|nr:phosphomannose isomerase type I [Phycomyces nitens]
MCHLFKTKCVTQFLLTLSFPYLNTDMTVSTHPTIYRLQCKTQCYDWGKLGDVSKVAKFAESSGTAIDPSLPYAELWMGTHPNAPSIAMNDDQETLREIIRENPDLSTQAVYDQYEGDLPFLFKILSIRKALSIQAHPDKILGARLFRDFPEHYKDPNHKPEMAIALTPFEALCGFRPLSEIGSHLEMYPEFAAIVGPDATDSFLSIMDSEDIDQKKAALKEVFSALMKSPQDRVKELLAEMVERLEGAEERDELDNLILRLDQQYPGGDVGVFAVLLLNYIKMEPGQAIFLGANEPHAYLSGDCVECMAASDNVVRSGLTPKFKHVDVLVDMLTYRYGSAESQKMVPVKFSDHSLLYDPPIEEFSVVLSSQNPGDVEREEAIKGPSILLVTRGSGELKEEKETDSEEDATYPLEEGYVYFIGANVPISAVAGDDGLDFYRAFTVLPELEA